MSDRFPGGVISKTPPTVVAPVDGEGGSASGVWTLDTVLGYEKASGWPKRVLSRSLYSWGANNYGQLGQNNKISRSSPVQVGALITWDQVAATSSTSFSIKTDGTLWSWGSSSFGQLGLNDAFYRSSPVQVGALTTWTTVKTGKFHVGAVKTDGTLWMWGTDAYGALGKNTRNANASSPVQIGSLTTWSSLGLGGNTSAAIKTDGTLWTWGYNDRGALGHNDRISRSSPVQVGALSNWATIAGGDISFTAIKTDGTLWAWGAPGLGSLGTNDYISRSSPVQIGALADWSSVARGPAGNFVIARKTDGTIWTWGANINGELGDGTRVNKSSPVKVGLLTTWDKVGAGNQHSLAIKTDGTLWTWGRSNLYGQIGDGTRLSRSSPVQIGSLTNWYQATGGDQFSLAITRG